MSAAATSAPAAAASARSPPKKRPRHFREGPDRTDEGDEEKQGAAHVAPVTRLYRHALESVFGFLKLKHLGRVASVSRLWSAAVRSMGSIHAVLTGCHRSYPPPPHLLAASALAHHVSELGFADPVSSCDLLIFSRQLSSLTSLRCTVQLDDESRVYLGSTLRTLWLCLEGPKDAPIINDAIVTVSRLPNLEDLTLILPQFYPAVSFAPLTTAARLRDLTLRGQSGEGRVLHPVPTLPQLDQLRMLPHLRKVVVNGLSNDGLAYLLRAPHPLQWQETDVVYQIDDAAAGALATLPTLTKLDTYCCLSVAFLPALTRLRSLDLWMNPSAHLAADIVAGLSCCTQLTTLSLMSARDVTSAHLCEALSRLPLLRSLTLTRCSALDSLSFLSHCPDLAQSLQSLGLCGGDDPTVPSTELDHVLTLQCLTSLELVGMFVEPLDERTQYLLAPVSVVLPALQRFSYRPN